jgi:hypothetical protein
MLQEDPYPPEGKQFGNEFLKNHSKQILFSKISTISPMIIFPLLSFYFQNWWLLLGILFWNLGGFLSMNNIPLAIALILTISYNAIFGFALTSYVNIFFCCFVLGFIAFTVSSYQMLKFEKTKLKIKEEIDSQFEEYRKSKE